MRTNVYVDGFNLYYGALRGTLYKWLDIRRMCELLLPSHTIARIKYFTARISATPSATKRKPLFSSPTIRTSSNR